VSDPIVPFKLSILRAMTESLKAITPANGFGSNLADFDPGDGIMTARVFRGRPWFGDDDPIPLVSILEGTSPADELFEQEVDQSTGAYDWPLLVQGFVDDDKNNPTDPAYFLMRDVRKKLADEKKRVKPGRHTPDPFGVSTYAPTGCGIERLIIGPGVVRPADDVSAKAWFWLTLTLRIVETADSA